MLSCCRVVWSLSGRRCWIASCIGSDTLTEDAAEVTGAGRLQRSLCSLAAPRPAADPAPPSPRGRGQPGGNPHFSQLYGEDLSIELVEVYIQGAESSSYDLDIVLENVCLYFQYAKKFR